MQRRRVSVVLATVLAVLGLVSVTALPVDPALAQVGGQCDEVVVDETGQLDAGAIQAAAADLEDAQVRVRFYESVPGGDLAPVVDDLLATCWPGPGGVQSDLLLLAVSLGDRETFLRWGDALTPGLGGGTGEAIRDDVVNPRLAQGNFTEAAVEGLDAIDEEVEAAAVDPADEGGGAVAQPAAEDDSNSWVPLAALVALGALAAAVVASVRRRNLNERRRRLDEAIEEPLGRAGDLRERARQLELRAATAEHALAGAALARLQGLRGEARRASHEVDGVAVLLRQATPEGVDDASHDQLEQAEARVAELAQAVAASDAALSSLDRALRRMDELRVTLPTKHELLAEELADTRELAEQRAAEGWRTDELVTDLDQVAATLDRLDLSPLRLDVDTLSQRLEQAEADLFAARHGLQTLPERRAGLVSWAEQLAESVRLESERTEAARAELERLATIHDPASFASLLDNPSEAVVALAHAERTRAAAMAEPFEAQDWDETGRRLEEAGLHLFRADAFLDEIDQASIDLAEAHARAGSVLEQARRALDEVTSFVRTHDADLGPRFDTEPAALDSLIVGLGAELRRRRPNYLRVLQTAEQGVADLNRLMSEAQDEQARIAALRRQADQEVAWAVAAVSRARQALGWQIIPSREGRDLAQLEESLDALPRDLLARIEAAQSIAIAAQRIEARIINRRRRGSVWIVGGNMGGGWSGGGLGGGMGGGSGGGGGSFGGGGFGGGSFGGGGFGGGGFGGGGGGSSW